MNVKFYEVGNMKILRNGRKPEEFVLYGKCGCGCEFIAEQDDYKIESNSEGAVYISRCPCCNKENRVIHKTKTFTDSRKPNYWKDN